MKLQVSTRCSDASSCLSLAGGRGKSSQASTPDEILSPSSVSRTLQKIANFRRSTKQPELTNRAFTTGNSFKFHNTSSRYTARLTFMLVFLVGIIHLTDAAQAQTYAVGEHVLVVDPHAWSGHRSGQISSVHVPDQADLSNNIILYEINFDQDQAASNRYIDNPGVNAEKFYDPISFRRVLSKMPHTGKRDRRKSTGRSTRSKSTQRRLEKEKKKIEEQSQISDASERDEQPEPPKGGIPDPASNFDEGSVASAHGEQWDDHDLNATTEFINQEFPVIQDAITPLEKARRDVLRLLSEKDITGVAMMSVFGPLDGIELSDLKTAARSVVNNETDLKFLEFYIRSLKGFTNNEFCSDSEDTPDDVKAGDP